MSFRIGLLVSLLLVLGSSRNLLAQSASREDFHHIPMEDISNWEKAANFGFIYTAQWGIYYATQEDTIEAHGSFKNWHENMTKPHFDKDHFNYNIFKHTLTGQYYYLFYRSRGYDMKDAFAWAAISSFAFEFAIETTTERPSYQDMYQTPVFGTIVGMGFERVSLYLHSLQTWPTSMLGYIFNPFTVLPSSHYQMGFYPTKYNDKAALALSLEMKL